MSIVHDIRFEARRERPETAIENIRFEFYILLVFPSSAFLRFRISGGSATILP